MYYLCSENKGVLISFAVTARLICVFVFAYAKRRFSHNKAHIKHDMFLALTDRWLLIATSK